MPYLLNKQEGANFRHPEIGVVPPLTAIEITLKQYVVLKNNVAVIVFKNIMVKEDTKQKPMEVLKTYDDFVLENKGDMIKASTEWGDYQKEKGLIEEEVVKEEDKIPLIDEKSEEITNGSSTSELES